MPAQTCRRTMKNANREYLHSMKQIAIVMTCKGRLHHVKQTLPLILEQDPDEMVFVEYGCPQNAGNWVAEHHPGIKVIYVNDDPGLCVSRARNMGARDTKSIGSVSLTRISGSGRACCNGYKPGSNLGCITGLPPSLESVSGYVGDGCLRTQGL